MVVRPAPPLGEKTAITWWSPSSVGSAGAGTVGREASNWVRRASSRSKTVRMLAENSSPLNGLTRNSRAPAEIARFS